MEFEEVKGGGSLIWQYFKREKVARQHAKCKQCGDELKCFGGSTSSLISHMRTKHKIVVKKTEESKESNPNANKKLKIMDYFERKRDETLPAILSRMVARDGLAFRVFITSIDLRMLLEFKGFAVPKSATTIKDIVIKYSEEIKLTTINILIP